MKTILRKATVAVLWLLTAIAGFFITQRLMPGFSFATLENLSNSSKEQYLISVAHAYAYHGSLPRVIDFLNDAGIRQPTVTIEDMLSRMSEGDIDDARRLSSLLVDLGGEVPPPIETALIQSLTVVPTVTAPRPESVTGESTEIPPTPPEATPWTEQDFSLVTDTLCMVSETPLVEVRVVDERGYGIPGHIFDLGVDDDVFRVFTGLRSDIDPGYLDFMLTEGVLTIFRPVSIDDESHSFELTPCTSETGEEGFLNYLLTYTLIQETS